MLIDYAESERIGQWSLRSALVRYAQPEPTRASRVHESIRRLDAALAPLRSRIERPGEAERLTELAAAWRVEPTATDDPAVPLLAVALEFDELADVVTVWAHDIREPRPNNAVDQACARIEALLELLGVPRESMDPSEWRGRARQ